MNVTPFGSVPARLNVGAGLPVAVTVSESVLPTTILSALVLVKPGATKPSVGVTMTEPDAVLPAAFIALTVQS